MGTPQYKELDNDGINAANIERVKRENNAKRYFVSIDSRDSQVVVAWDTSSRMNKMAATSGQANHAGPGERSSTICIVSATSAKDVAKDARKEMKSILDTSFKNVAAFYKKKHAAKVELQHMTTKEQIKWATREMSDLQRTQFTPSCVLKVKIDKTFDYPIPTLFMDLSFTSNGLSKKQIVVKHTFGANDIRKSNTPLRIRKITHRSMLDPKAYPTFPIDKNFPDANAMTR